MLSALGLQRRAARVPRLTTPGSHPPTADRRPPGFLVWELHVMFTDSSLPGFPWRGRDHLPESLLWEGMPFLLGETGSHAPAPACLASPGQGDIPCLSFCFGKGWLSCSGRHGSSQAKHTARPCFSGPGPLAHTRQPASARGQGQAWLSCSGREARMQQLQPAWLPLDKETSPA